MFDIKVYIIIFQTGGVEYEIIQTISHGGAAEVTLAHSYEVPVITKK